MTRRFLFIQLPYFAMERFERQVQHATQQTKPWWDEDAHQQDKEAGAVSAVAPRVLIETGAKGTRIKAVGPDALEEGFWIGMKLADARSMQPDLRVEQHNQVADTKALSRLAQWLLRYSPAVSICGDDGFLLDTTGCDHLFGGELCLLEEIRERLQRAGYSARLALSDSVAASIAVVKYGRDAICVLPPGHSVDMLKPLPVDALRLDDQTVLLLKRLGLKTIGDVQPLPRTALERRFRTVHKGKRQSKPSQLAQSVQWRLDQLTGAISEPLTYIKEPQPFRVLLPCPELALEPEAVGLALEQLLPKIFTILHKAGMGARGFRLTGYRADGGSSYAEIYLSQPDSTAGVIKRLFNDRLDRINCGYGIDLFLLEAVNAEKISAAQNGMMGVEAQQITAASLTAFADIVDHKTNMRSVVKFAPHASHVPERAQRSVPVTENVDWLQKLPAQSARPTRLLARPEPAEVTAELPDSPPAQFVWRKVVRRVVRSRGPERILPEWWKDEISQPGKAGIRDYYDVEDSVGLRYWIYRAIKDHEIDSGETGSEATERPPEDAQSVHQVRTVDWFVHGLF